MDWRGSEQDITLSQGEEVWERISATYRHSHSYLILSHLEISEICNQSNACQSISLLTSLSNLWNLTQPV